ncbi:MAG: tryptophan--tRNA ligase, partial [Chromatiales bacterium]
GLVPVGEDQVAHVELTREVARRFNHLYGREPDFEAKTEQAIKKMGKKNARLYQRYRKGWQESGDEEGLAAARALIEGQQNITVSDKDRLLGYLEGGGKVILPEPQPLLTRASKMPGLDGQKMSKSYGNTISLRADPDTLATQLRKMPTDPARVRRTDPGNPANCPVWQFHAVYSDDKTQKWVREGCTSAGIGCIECKQPVIDAVLEELRPIQERAREFEEQPDVVSNIINEGCEHARDEARETLDEVRHVMSLDLA